MKNRNKKILICGISLSVFLLIFGVTYAFFNYTGVTNESVLKAGTIYMKLSSLNEDIVLNNVFPQTREEAENRDDNYIDFEVKGKNTYNKPIYYEISTVYGSVPSGFTDDDRINDCDIMVELIDLTSGKVLVTKNYASLNNTKLYVKTIEPSNDENKDRYRLRIWIKENTLISDSDPNKSYCASSYCNDLTKKIYSELFVSLKAKIYADFSEKTTDPTCFDYFEDTENSGEYIITGYHDDCSINCT